MLLDNQEYTNEKFSKLHEEKKIFSEIEFYDCEFDSCYFLECTFQKCSFTNCKFTNCDISAIKVPNSKFIDVIFANSKVIGVDWTQTGKIGSQMPMTLQFTKTVINYSSFFGLDIPNIVMTDCTIHEVDFGNANVTNANFRNSDFHLSKFLNTNLSKADFRSAINYAIDPQANNVKKTKFSLPEAMSLLRGFEVIIE